MKREKHSLAGKSVVLKTKPMEVGHDPDELNGKVFRIEDWWINLPGVKSWMYMNGNPACMKYGIRSGCSGLPMDDNVVYGKVGIFGHLVHESELGQEVKKPGE